MASVKVAVLGGVALASPVILYHTLRFVSPGLRAPERRIAILTVVMGAALFAAGVAFAYVCVAPPALAFCSITVMRWLSARLACCVTSSFVFRHCAWQDLRLNAQWR